MEHYINSGSCDRFFISWGSKLAVDICTEYLIRLHFGTHSGQ